jgi:DNA repair exonuclease SbcCD ATPase subunit
MADKIVAEYIVKTDKAIKNLDKLEKEVKDLSKQGKKAAKDIEGNFKKTSEGLVSQFSKVGAALGLAFGAQQLISFGKEAVGLAAKAEGISKAFSKLNNPNLLNDLRKATRGTVSDLELMQSAVKAKNFKIPLEQLAGFFKFATNRAIETGESVDYLVESIINGIGRKSSLVLDNLGISATELQEEMKKTGDFGAAAGNIIARELEKAGDVADTAAIKIAKMATAFENFKTEFGGELITQITELNDEVSKTADLLGFEGVDAGSIALAGLKRIIEELLSPITALNWIIQKNIEAFNLLRGEMSPEEIEKEEKAVSDLANAFANMRKAIDDGKESLEEIDEVQIEVIKNLKFYNDLIEELQTKQKDANTTRAEVRQLEDEINEAIRQRLILLGRLREIGGASMQEIESIASMELDVQQELTDDIISDSERRNDEIKKLQDELNASLAEKAAEQREAQVSQWQGYGDQVSSIIGSISQIQANAYAYEQQELDNQLKQGLITREEYDRKRAELARKQAQSAKDAQLFQATISTAQAIVAALGSVPFTPANIALSALVGAAGAAQIAAIASAPLPQFAEGGWVDSKGKIHGRSHAQGGVFLEAERDEFIVKGNIARNNASLLESLNAGNGQDWINRNMVYPAIQNVLDNGDTNQFNNLDIKFKDSNLIASQDRMRQSTVYGLKMVASKLDKLSKRNNRVGW